MKHYLPSKTHALSCVAAILLTACGGGGGNNVIDTIVDVVVPPKTITGVIADGLIQGAVMCYDVNDNNKCDDGEPKSSPSAADGSFSISIPASAAGKHAMIATIPATAIDSDNPGVPIGVPLTMMAPLQADASLPLFVSPLTTAVAELMIASGNTDKEAAKAAAVTQVAQTLGLTVSPLDNFITPPAGTDPAAAAQAHANAQVITEVKKAITTTAIAANVPPADFAALVSQAVSTNLPAVAIAVSNQGSQTPAQAAISVVTITGITPATVVTQTSIATSLATGSTAVAPATIPTVGLRSFSYTDANNWNYRLFTSDNVADSNGFKYSNEVRVIKDRGADGRFNRNTSFFDTTNNKWYECPSDGYKIIRFTDATASSPSTSLYCHSIGGNSRRVTADITGKTIASIVDRIIAAGLPTNDDTAWKSVKAGLSNQTVVFPAGSKLSLGLGADTDIPDQHSLSDKVQVTPSGESMTSTTTPFANWPYASSLDHMIEHNFGDFTTVPLSNINGNFTIGIASLPDLSVSNPNLQKIAFYRVGFNPSSATAGQVRYYKCRRNDQAVVGNTFTTGCEIAANSTYAIETKGDGRVLRLSGVPAAVTAFRKNNPIYVERAGAVMYGWTGIPSTVTSARLNNEAWVALRTQFAGVTPHIDPVAPVATETGSWLRDLRDLATGFSYRITQTFGALSGTGNEVRATYTCPSTGDCPTSAQQAPDTFTRNRLFLVGGVWKDSDAGGVCPSNGINLFTWTANPRQSIGCGGQTEAHTGFDVDISNRSFASVFAEGRAYSSKAYGSDTRNWGGNPSDADNGVQKFPAGSKLRYQQSTITTVSPSFGIANFNKVQNWFYNTATSSSNAVDTTSIADMVAHYDGVRTATKTGIGNVTVQIYSHQAYGTPAQGTTGLKRYRVAFTPSSATGGTATYHNCDTQITTNYSINCSVDTTTPYTISTLSGKTVLNFSFNADQINGINNEQKFGEVFFAEHNGKVYYGSKDFIGSKHNTLRLNQTAYEHMLYDTWQLNRVAVTPTATMQ